MEWEIYGKYMGNIWEMAPIHGRRGPPGTHPILYRRIHLHIVTNLFSWASTVSSWILHGNSMAPIHGCRVPPGTHSLLCRRLRIRKINEKESEIYGK